MAQDPRTTYPVAPAGGGEAAVVAAAATETTTGLIVLTTDNTGAAGFIDQTAAATSGTGSTFPAWQGTGAGHRLLIGLVGATPRLWEGWRAVIDAALDLGSGSIVVEYHTGIGPDTYTAVDTMTTDAVTQARHGTSLFERIADEQTRLGDMPSGGGLARLAVGTINGTAASWISVRIVGEIDTIPDIESVALHLDASTSGQRPVEHMGTNRLIKTLPLDWGAGIAVQSFVPSGGLANLSNRGERQSKTNQFGETVDDRYMWTPPIPEDCDTSKDWNMSVLFMPTDGSGGTIEWTASRALLAAGQVADGSTVAQVVPKEVAAPTTTNEMAVATFPGFTLPTALPSPTNWWQLVLGRLATLGNDPPDDAPSAKVVEISLTYTAWK